MGLFDLSDILPLSKLLFGETPNVYDVIDFVDTVTMESNLTDEKRSFYEKATEKYKVAYTSIKTEYQLIKDFIENHKDSSEQSISILKGLTEEKDELEKIISEKVNVLATQHNISADDIWLSLNSGSVLISNDTRPVLSKFSQSMHDSNRNDARQQGYTKAKGEFENAVKGLIHDLAQRKTKEKDELQEILDKMIRLFIAVSEDYMKNTELEIVAENSFHS